MNLLSFDVGSRRPRGVSMVALSAGSDHDPYTPIFGTTRNPSKANAMNPTTQCVADNVVMHR